MPFRANGSDRVLRAEDWRCVVRRSTKVFLAFMMVTCLGVMVAPAGADVWYFHFTLDGQQVVPPTNSQATGWGSYRYDDERRILDIECYLEGIAQNDLTAIHAHIGAYGAPGHGQVIFNLGHPDTWEPLGDGLFWEGFVANFPPEFVDELLNDLTYVIAHSRQHPGGEIRGQQLVAPRLTHTALMRGQQVTMQVDRALPGDQVIFLYSLNGVGQGPVVPQLGGLQLDIRNPVIILDTRTANGAGRATFTTTIPPGAPPVAVALQAAIRRGQNGVDSVETNTSTTAILP